MRYFFFYIKNNKIDKIQRKGLGNASQYTHYEKSVGFEEIYYKVENNIIVTVMCEANSQELATKAVNLFLSGLESNV